MNGNPLNNPIVSNPNDLKVVTFHNSTEFGFTAEMGCMFDGRAINGVSGNGIEAGESKLLPYHVGHRLAVNLAKRVYNTSPAATVDAAGIPTGVPVWNATKLQELANTYITEEYSEDKPIAMSETDRLMAKVAELERFMKESLASQSKDVPTAPVVESVATPTESIVAPNGNVAPEDTNVAAEAKPEVVTNPKEYLDKKEVIDELTKRGVKFNTRSTKADLEKLLV